MSRIKKVFGSHSQLAHVWAQQKQTEGKASRMFFENTTDIYSYGRHYLAARIHTVKGKKFTLVRSDSYSVSTGKHLSNIRSAVSGLMPYFNVENVTDIKEAVKQLDNEAQQSIKDALKRIKIETRSDIHWVIKRIQNEFKNTNELRKLVGRAEIKPKKTDLAKVKAHLEFRLKRFKELNTPEMQEKREQEKLKRKERQEKREQASIAEKIEFFRQGKNVDLTGLEFELLRIRGNKVVTSRGAVVPLDAAKVLYKAIISGRDVTGTSIGHFTVRAIEPAIRYEGNRIPQEDKIVTVGCHKIMLSEAKRVLDE